MQTMPRNSDDIKAMAWDMLTDTSLDFRFGDRDRLWSIATRKTAETARDLANLNDIRIRVGARVAA